jgi:hypothetical protein
MTLQFRSRIKSAIDYSSELNSNGVCCEHNTSPDRPDTVPEYRSYLSSANQCYSDQNDGSFITRTFYSGIKSAEGFDCLQANEPGCCCSCSYARESDNYTTFLNNIQLPVDYTDPITQESRCDINEYDLDIALYPDVGMKNNVSQCECNRIGGKWTAGSCPSLSTSAPSDPTTYSYKFYYQDNQWLERPEKGSNSKTEVIRKQCYKQEELEVKTLEGGGPDDVFGTCCLGPTKYNDYGCYFEVVTADKCQQISCDNGYHGLGDGKCVSYQWYSCGSENIRDCERCWNSDPLEGWCCPDENQTPEKYAQVLVCSSSNDVSNGNYTNYEINFDGTVYTKTGNLSVSCPDGHNFIEDGECEDCIIKGLCCNRTAQQCNGWITESECKSKVPGDGDRVWNSTQNCTECSNVCCGYPLGRCCYENADGETVCETNKYKSECNALGGLWSSTNDCADDACGTGLCCNYANFTCLGGRTEQQCCGSSGCSPETKIKYYPDNDGTDCNTDICRFDKGICCSTNFVTGGEQNICHGYTTQSECDFIESSGFYAQTNWDPYYTTCETGCPNFINEDTGICCQDGSSPIITPPYTPDGSYENCADVQKVTEFKCLYGSLDPDPEADLILNRKWYGDAEDCAICTSQQTGRCCNYCTNGCTQTTQSSCCGSDGSLCATNSSTAKSNSVISGSCPINNSINPTKTWVANNTDCPGCEFNGRCCYMEIDTANKKLIPRCSINVQKTTCENTYKGIWSSTNSCENNVCGWGTCCNLENSGTPQIQNAKGRSCTVVPLGDYCTGSHSWSPTTNLQTLEWLYDTSPGAAYNPGAQKGEAGVGNICGLTNNLSSVGNYYPSTHWKTHTLFGLRECKLCNNSCNYTGAACQFINCSQVTCTGNSSTCACNSNIKYSDYVTSLASDTGNYCATWYGNNSTTCSCTGCLPCNTQLPTYSMSAPTEVNEGQAINIVWSATGVNPSITSQDFSYIVTPSLGGFSFNNDIVSGISQDVITKTVSNGSWTETRIFNTSSDAATEGAETFEIKGYAAFFPSNPLVRQVTITDTSQAPEFDLSFTPALYNSGPGQGLCEKGFRNGLPTGTTFTFAKLSVKNVPSGTTYNWSFTSLSSGASYSDFKVIGSTGGLTLGTISTGLGFFDQIGLTLNQDSFTDRDFGSSIPEEGYEKLTFTIKDKNGNIVQSKELFLYDESFTPEYFVVAPDQIEEGASNYSSFDITTKYVDPGTTLIWQIQGEGIVPGDFEFFPGQTGEAYYGNGLTGVIVIGGTYNNGSLFTRNSGNLVDQPWFISARQDAIETPDEGFTFAVYSSGASLAANQPLARKQGILIIEPTSFLLDFIPVGNSGSVSPSVGLSSVQEGDSTGFLLRVLAKNVAAGVTYGFAIKSPGITGNQLEGFGGTDSINWSSAEGYTGLFTLHVPGGGITATDTCKVKLNYNQFTDSGKTMQFYLFGSNLGGSGATSGIITVSEPTNFSLANTPELTFTMNPPAGEIAETISGGRLNGITFTLFSRGVGAGSGGATPMAISGSSGPSIISARILPGAGLSYDDFNIIRLSYNTASGIKTDTFQGFNDPGWTSGFSSIPFIIGTKDTNLGHTATIFLGISADKKTDLNPCSGPTYEGFTFALLPNQTVRRPYFPTDFSVGGQTFNVKVYETSTEEPVCQIYSYRYNNGVWQPATQVKENDLLKFELFATKSCPGSKYKVEFEPIGNFNLSDVDFTSQDTSFTQNQFTGLQEFNFVMPQIPPAGQDYTNGIISLPIYMKLKVDTDYSEGTEAFKIQRYSQEWQYYNDGNPLTPPNYVLNIQVEDTPAPAVNGTCCNASSSPFCSLTTEFNCTNSSGSAYKVGNIWQRDEKCPTSDECKAYVLVLDAAAQTIIAELAQQGYDISLFSNPAAPVRTCTACCGFKETTCCNFNTGVKSTGCITGIKGSYPCLSGEPIGPTDVCCKRVVCCNDFNNTCRLVCEDECTGIFERSTPSISGTCSDCNFDNVDPSCDPIYGSKSIEDSNPLFSQRGSQFWIQPSSSLNLFEFEKTAIASIPEWASVTPPVNSLEYGCSIDICCKGNGSGCRKVKYTWQQSGGVWQRTLTGANACSGFGDTLLSEQFKEFKGAGNNDIAPICSASKAVSWVGGNATFNYLFIYNNIPWDSSDFNFGVCCGLSGSNSTYACKGSTVTRDWCLGQTPANQFYRWIASDKECETIKIAKNPGTAQGTIESITLPKYDCEICKEVQDKNYYYPGTYKSYSARSDENNRVPRDWYPGTLPKDAIIPACEGCLWDPSTYLGSVASGDVEYVTYKEYFTNIPSGSPSGAYAPASWMNYYSLPENILSRRANPDDSLTPEYCCGSFANVYPVRSNFLVPSGATPTTKSCNCDSKTCACETTTPGTCPGFDYSECDDDPPAPLGVCCLSNGDCSIVEQNSCGGTWTECSGGACTCNSGPGGGNPCALGACCNGDSCTVVAGNQCGGTFKGANSTCAPDNPCTDQDDPGICCNNGFCSSSTRSQCVEDAQGYVTFTAGGSCSDGICNSTQRVACCNGTTCTETPQSGCSETAKGSSCAGNPCASSTGACCFTYATTCPGGCTTCVSANNATECAAIAAAIDLFGSSNFTPGISCAQANCDSYCCCSPFPGAGCVTCVGPDDSQQACEACQFGSTYKKCSECCGT